MTRPRSALPVRALALLDVSVVVGLGGLYVLDFLRTERAWMSPRHGSISAWALYIACLVVPGLLLGWLAVGLWRLERAAWVLRVGVGLLTVPLFGVGLLALAVLLPRSSRSLFGIGTEPVPPRHPLGLAVLGALDHLLGHLLALLAVAWGLMLLNMGIRVASPAQAVKAWLLLGALPLVLSAAFLWVGRQLERGARAGRVAQGVLLPPALPYLLRPHLRALFEATPAARGPRSPGPRRVPLALLLGCAGLVALVAGLHLRRVPSRAPRTLPEEAVALRFEPVGEPDARESFMGESIGFLGFTDGGRQLLSGERNGLFVWDVERRRRVLRTPPGRALSGVHWVGTPPGTEDAFALPAYPSVLQGSTRGWTLERRVDLQPLVQELEAYPITGVVDARGHVLLAFQPNAALHLFDLHERRLLHTLVQDVERVKKVSFDRAGSRVALLQPFSHVKTSVWDVATGQRLFALRTEGPPPGEDERVLLNGVALSPDGRRLVTAEQGTLDFWDVDTGARLERVPDTAASDVLVFEPRGRLLAVSTWRTGDAGWRYGVKVFRADGSGLVYASENHPTFVTALAFNDEGTLLASGDSQGEVRFHPLDGRANP